MWGSEDRRCSCFVTVGHAEHSQSRPQEARTGRFPWPHRNRGATGLVHASWRVDFSTSLSHLDCLVLSFYFEMMPDFPKTVVRRVQGTPVYTYSLICTWAALCLYQLRATCRLHIQLPLPTSYALFNNRGFLFIPPVLNCARQRLSHWWELQILISNCC